MSQSILRSGVTSPARAFMKRPSTPRSILKRPTSLALSPSAFPFHANFSIQVSPVVSSPHVHFPASPSLAVTFTTHSSQSYDRAPIVVSPNPMKMPSWGDRIYSPSIEGFKLSAPPKPRAVVQKRLNSILKCDSPAITEFEDPRSPKPTKAMEQNVRFASFAPPSQRSSRDIGKALSSFPRSPYPSAPLSPSTNVEMTEEARGRQWPLHAESVTAPPARSRSVDERTAPRQVTASRQAVSFAQVASPLRMSFKAPQTAGVVRSHRPAPLDLETPPSSNLSNAFWQSVSMEAETPMVTALEYPESAMEMENIQLNSPAPALVFGGKDGGVWSPGIPRKPAARELLLRDALMSPGNKASFKKVSRAFIASPSPNDPFAAFPSFTAALSVGATDASIAYPPRVVLERA